MTHHSKNTLYNVSTSGDVQYIGGRSVHRGMFSTSGVFSTSRGYHEYIKGYSVHRGCSVHRRDTTSTSGDVMSTSGMFSTSEGYHDTCGGAT